MGITVKEKDAQNLDQVTDEVVILPSNYDSDETHEYHSTTISFYKYAKTKIPVKYLSEPELLIEQRSGDWFGPLLLISSFAFSHNPELIAITCSVVANYVTDFFKGQKPPNIRLKVLYKESKSSKVTEISYEGDLEGLKYLETSVHEIASKSGQND